MRLERAQKPKIFQTFQLLDSSTNRPYGLEKLSADFGVGFPRVEPRTLLRDATRQVAMTHYLRLREETLQATEQVTEDGSLTPRAVSAAIKA